MNFWETSDGPAHDGTTRGEDVYSRLNAYAGKSEEQLFEELKSAADALKAPGKFDPGSLENLYATSAPFLSREQLSRMRAIIDMLKGN